MIHPHPALSPLEVVRIMVAALQENDVPHPDRGIEIVWEFASPANKVVTGPLDRFKKMVHNPVYGLMLNHDGAKFTRPMVVDNRARVDVFLRIERLGGSVVFRFDLSRQRDGDQVGCWMTDSVVPIAPSTETR